MTTLAAPQIKISILVFSLVTYIIAHGCDTLGQSWQEKINYYWHGICSAESL
jgi:hypothetical protein